MGGRPAARIRVVLATRSFAYLSAVLSFAYVLRGTFLHFPTTALEVSLLATLAVYVVEKRLRRESFPDPRRLAYFWPVMLLLLAATISVLVSPERRAAAGIWKAYFIEPALIAYVLADVLRSRDQLVKLIGGFFLSGILVSTFQVLGFLYAVGIHRPLLVEQPVVVLYFTPNATGLFLGPLLAIALALALYGNRAERFRGVVFIVLSGPAFVLSFSRGAWLGLVAATVFLAYHHRHRVLLLGATALGVAGALLVPAVRRRLGHEFDPHDPFNTINLRVELWRATAHMMSNPRHLLLGTGLSGFKHDIAAFRAPGGYQEDLIYPHNIYLDFYTETGLLGLAAFVWLTASWVRTTARALKAATELRALHLALAAASVELVVHGMLDVPFFKNDLSFLMFALVGVQVAALRLDPTTGLPRTREAA